MKPIKKIGTCCILSIEKFVVRSNIEAANIIGIAKKMKIRSQFFDLDLILILPLSSMLILKHPGLKQNIELYQQLKPVSSLFDQHSFLF